MSTLSPFIPLFATIFVITWLVLPAWIRNAKKVGVVGKDIHKWKERKVAEMGGVIVLFAFIIGIILYIAMRVFLFNSNTNITAILAILSAVLIAGTIGIIDDILGWKIGLTQWQKPLLTILVAAPVMAVNAGTKIMFVPGIGQINLGLLYPLFMIPGFIVVGTNGFNMIAGYNGLEAGLGIILLSTVGYLSYINGSAWLAVVALCMVFALLGFLIYNYYPAAIFPGDTLTYTVGALIAMIAIFANIEKFFIILFIPYIIEFFMKLRGRFKKESFAIIHENGQLTPRYPKTYGLENLMVKLLNHLRVKTTEKRVVLSLWAFQLLFVLVVVMA